MITKSFIELALPLIIAFLISFCLIESIYPYYESYTTWHRYGIYENVSRHLSRTSLLGNTLSLAGICMLVFLLICYYPIRNLLEHKIQKPALFKQGLIIDSDIYRFTILYHLHRIVPTVAFYPFKR